MVGKEKVATCPIKRRQEEKRKFSSSTMLGLLMKLGKESEERFSIYSAMLGVQASSEKAGG